MLSAEAVVSSRRGLRAMLAALLLLAASGSAVGATEPPAKTVPAKTAPETPSTAVLGGTSRFDNGVVAVVDGDPITLRELKRYGVTGAPFLPADVRNDYRALLESMIEHRLLKAEFDKYGIHAPDEMVERYIAGVLEENHQTKAQLEIDIARTGLTWKDYFERMREEVQRIQLVNLVIRSRVNVSEEEVRRAWETDPQYVESEKMVVAAIFIPAPLFGEGADTARQQALEVQKEARGNFEAAARKYSKGPAASEGGHLGEFQRGTMAPHFEKALQGLGEGDVSMPVEGSGGFYIVKLVEIKSSGRVPFEDVKEKLTDQLYEKRLTERYKKWSTEDLRKDHRIDNLVDRLAVLAAGGATEPTAAQPSNAVAKPAAGAGSTNPEPGASGIANPAPGATPR